MHTPKYKYFFISLVVIIVWSSGAESKDLPPAEHKYQKYFSYYVDDRSFIEKGLDLIGLTDEKVGRSFALLCGISKYQYVNDLPEAAVDINKLKTYLIEKEFFSEVVVLMNKDFTLENLTYFLQSYFPERVSRLNRSRFLFAFSGHGTNKGNNGYLLKSTARNFEDTTNLINLSILRILLQEVIDNGHQVLALINSCYGGNFLRRSFGTHQYLPTKPGAHAITAGASNEKVEADPEVGPGSVFFETLLAGLDQRADTFPPAQQGNGTPGDGVITFEELSAWLKLSIRQRYRERVNPLDGELGRHKSLGAFFFLNRNSPVKSMLFDEGAGGRIFGPQGDDRSQPVTNSLTKVGNIHKVSSRINLVWIKLTKNISKSGHLILLSENNEKIKLRIEETSNFFATATPESGIHKLSVGADVYIEN